MTETTKSEFIEFTTYDRLKAELDAEYTREAFEREYAEKSGRTAKQMAYFGNDLVRQCLWTQFTDRKWEILREKELAESTKVIRQLEKAVRTAYPNITCTVNEGWTSKYGIKIGYTTMTIGAESGDRFVVTPTLKDEDGNFFEVAICTGYLNDTRHCDDRMLLEEVGKLAAYMKTGEKPERYLRRIYRLSENQYRVEYAGRSFQKYDIELMMMYHSLAKDLTDRCGAEYLKEVYSAEFPYSEEMIGRLRMQPICGNIHFVGEAYLTDFHIRTGGTLKKKDFFKSDGAEKPDHHHCITFGGHEMWELVELLETLKPYATSDYFAETSKRALDRKYAEYDRLGIGYESRPDYFDLLRMSAKNPDTTTDAPGRESTHPLKMKEIKLK